jgi:tRNA 5-methylaminomethyl-2-thiouridine biosynthesis bifunctional protein
MKLPPGRCAVVGAGLAGASVAHALALRGWQVAVFDTCPVVAAGASGLPAGLLVAHSSTDNSPRSRLTRSGARLMLGHARQHLQEGQDWALPGVMEYKMLRGGMRQQIWHPDAGWLKPGRMVQAWMGHPAITFNPNRKVRALEYFAGVWILRDRQLRELGHADLVVLANAMGCGPLLASLPSGVTPDANLIRQTNCLQAVHGFLTIGDRIALEKRTLRQALPKFPVNGSGSFIPEVPMADTARWFTGSTYASVEPDLSAIAEMHQNNIGRIGAILPDLADTLQYELDSTVLQHWTGVRCITRDRMPLVGPVHAQEPRSLWLCTGLGSRGLSLAALCAELLVARVCSEPLPIELNLAKKLDAARPFRQV